VDLRIRYVGLLLFLRPVIRIHLHTRMTGQTIKHQTTVGVMPRTTFVRELKSCAECGEAFQVYPGERFARCPSCRLSRHRDRYPATKAEQWILDHTFTCPVGKITDDHCAMLRARATVAEIARGQGQPVHGGHQWGGRMEPRPTVCESCDLWRDRGERMGMATTTKKQIQVVPETEVEAGGAHEVKTKPCSECGCEVVPYQRGSLTITSICPKCYTKKNEDRRIEANAQRRKMLMVPFDKHEELLERLTALAGRQFRSPEMQILQLIADATTAVG